MRIIKLYHGTNANPIEVMDLPKVTQCINGSGFYTTKDIDVAMKYGRNVVCWEINAEDFPFLAETPIDLSYVDGIKDYEHCKELGMEVILCQEAADRMALECINAYVLPVPAMARVQAY